MQSDQERTLRIAARYLGMRGEPPALLLEAYAEMLAAARPRHVLRRGEVRLLPGAKAGEAPQVAFDGLPPMPSRDLSRLLKGCEEGYAMVATLGMELDLRIRQLMVTAPGLGAAVGACGSAYVDVYMDRVLRAEAECQGLCLTRRFSPGYGDLSLRMQPSLLRLLGGQGVGVSLTEGLLMLPEKSVTALMGIRGPSQVGGGAEPGGCAACPQESCPYREEKAKNEDECHA